MQTHLRSRASLAKGQQGKGQITWGVRLAFLAVIVSAGIYSSERWQQWQAEDEVSPVEYRALVKLQYQYARNQNFNTLLQQAFADDKVTRYEFDYINENAAKIILKENIDKSLSGNTSDLVAVADNSFETLAMNQALEMNGEMNRWLDQARAGL